MVKTAVVADPVIRQPRSRMNTAIPPEYRGWWRIVDTGAWVNDGLDILGPALLSLTGDDDRLTAPRSAGLRP